MRIGDLTTGTSKLRRSYDTLRAVSSEVFEQWEDTTARTFEENYLRDLEPKVKIALEAMSRLSNVLSKAERELEPR
jgi:CHASE3 domain sensor protein